HRPHDGQERQPGDEAGERSAGQRVDRKRHPYHLHDQSVEGLGHFAGGRAQARLIRRYTVLGEHMRRRTESRSAGGLVSDPPHPSTDITLRPSSILSVINAYWVGNHVVVMSRDDQGGIKTIKHPAEYVCYL